MTSLKPALGNYAASERFWDREREVADLVEYLMEGHSVLVTGPRRVGKTSVVRRVLETIEGDARTIFLDVEQYADPTEMFAGLAAQATRDAKALQRIGRWFGKRLGDVASRLDSVEIGVVKIELQAAMAGSWRDDARAIVEALADDDRPTVIAVDELPLLVDRVRKADHASVELLMSTLRAFAGEFPAVRWIFSGSIGLEPVLHSAGLTSTVNHLRAYVIDGWDRETTVGAVEALAQGTELTLAPGAAEQAYDCLGLGVPYHVQLLMDELRRDAGRRADRSVSADDVQRVYRGRFLGSAVRTHLLHVESRLRVVLGEGDVLRLAYDVLTQAAVVGVVTHDDATLLATDVLEQAEDRAAVLREVLEILEHDAYLEPAEDGWRFRSRLVRDWWRQSNELGFVPADRRNVPA